MSWGEFQVPGECQGQIVETAFACCGDTLVRRVTDRSDGSVCFSVYEVEGDEWTWYEGWEPWGPTQPPLDEDEWEPVEGARLARILKNPDHD